MENMDKKVASADNPAITWESFPGPCYEPQERYGDCPPDLLTLMGDERIPANDRVWAFTVCTSMPDLTRRVFALRCVRETPLPDGPDGEKRTVFDLLKSSLSIAALDVAEKFVLGMASKKELEQAELDARENAGTDWDVVWAATWAVGAAARSARWAVVAAARSAVSAAEKAATRSVGAGIIAARAAAFQVEIAKSMIRAQKNVEL